MQSYSINSIYVYAKVICVSLLSPEKSQQPEVHSHIMRFDVKIKNADLGSKDIFDEKEQYTFDSYTSFLSGYNISVLCQHIWQGQIVSLPNLLTRDALTKKMTKTDKTH